jgi:ribonuclease PH
VPSNADRLRAELQDRGARRREARETDRSETAEIALLIPRALQAGITKSEISRYTGLSRVWIDELLRRDDQA